MGLAQNFKAYVVSTFAECVLPPDAAPAGAAVIDVMVILHMFDPKPDEEAPARRLAAVLWESFCDCPAAALCFDVSASTPRAKEMEWSRRPAPATPQTAEDIEEALMFDSFADYRALVSSREARSLLCRWLVDQMAARLRRRDGATRRLLVLGDDVPKLFTPDGAEARPDLARTMHGEADVSGIFAAHVLRSHLGADGPVECRTSDTDWVLIAALNRFPGLRVRLHHFDRASRSVKVVTVDPGALAEASTRRYGVSELEWAALVASRGTDFVDRLVSGLTDWDAYMSACASALRAAKRRRGEAAGDAVDAEALHSAFVSASAAAPRSKLRYERNDGALARLAWHVLYMANCPLRGGDGLDCLDFGWRLDEAGRVAHRKVKPRLFGLATEAV